MVINIGTDANDEILSAIDRIDGVHDSKYIRLNIEE